MCLETGKRSSSIDKRLYLGTPLEKALQKSGFVKSAPEIPRLVGGSMTLVGGSTTMTALGNVSLRLPVLLFFQSYLRH